MGKYFTSKIMVQITHEDESLDTAEKTALDILDRLSKSLIGMDVGDGNTVVHLFLLSINNENGEED